MNKCVCCYSPATQIRDKYYHCDDCADEWDDYDGYIDEGMRAIDAKRCSGYMGPSSEYRELKECNV